MLPRNTYLSIAGVSLEFFKSLSRRDQVPLLGRSPLSRLTSAAGDIAKKVADAVDARGYHAEEALMLAIADHMATQNSFSRAAAQELVQSHWDVLPGAVHRTEDGEDIWFAVGSWDFGDEKQAREDDPQDRGHWSFVETGTFDEVITRIKQEQVTTEENEGVVDNIAMFNVSLVIRKAYVRAAEGGIDIKFFPRHAGV